MARERPNQTTCKRIATPRWIDRFHRWERWARKNRIFVHHKCAIHAALDDNRLRPKRLYPLRRSHDALFFAQKTRLGFVQHEHVDHRQNALQIGIRRINPQIQRIGGNEFRLRLLDDFELQMRNDIGEEEEIAILLSIAQIGLEIGKHVQIGAKRRRLGQIIAVCPLPLERLALLRLDRRQIDATFDEKLELPKNTLPIRPNLSDRAPQVSIPYPTLSNPRR